MPEQDRKPKRHRARRWGGAAALVASGLVACGVMAGTLSANADTAPTPGTANSYSTLSWDNRPGGARDESRSMRPDEQLLTGNTATKVREAALAKYPGATISRVETDSDGVYEAHLLTADGQRLVVEMGKDFAVTGNESPAAGGGMPGRPGNVPSPGSGSPSQGA